MSQLNIRQFDSNRRISLPPEVLDEAKIASGDYANITYNPDTQAITIQLMTFAPKAEVEAAKAPEAGKTPAAPNTNTSK